MFGTRKLILIIHVHTHTHRYVNSGAESSLEECAVRMRNLQTTAEEKGKEKKAMEERIKTLQKQLANSKVC